VRLAVCLLLQLAPTFALTFVVEGESLAPRNAPRGVDGAPAGWFVVPFHLGDESSAAALVSASTLAAGQVSRAAAQINVPAGSYRLWARVSSRAGFTLSVGPLTLAVAPGPDAADGYVWVALNETPIALAGPTDVTLADDEPTASAALDLLAFSDDPGFDPAALPLPRWPNAGAATGLSARFWLPALLDEPLYLSAGLTWPVLLALTNRSQTETVAGASVLIELPPGVTLLDPTKRDLAQFGSSFTLSNAPPRSMLQAPLPGGGTRYELGLAPVPPWFDGMVEPQGAVALLLQTAADAPASGTIRVGCRLPEQSTSWTTCDVMVFPPPRLQRGPQAAAWILDLPFLEPFSEAERVAVLQSAARLGFNRVSLVEELWHDDPAADQRYSVRYAKVAAEARAAGLEPVLRMARWIPWAPQRTYSDRYLARHPNAAAVLAPGARAAQQGRGMVSPTALLEDDGDYFDERLNALGTLARLAALREVYWDFEESRPLELSFDPATLDLFRRVANLPQPGLGPAPPMTAERVLADPVLRRQWIGFRCEQNSAIAGLLRRRLNALIPGLKLYVYSGFQSDQTAATYGIDWRLLASHADAVIAGSEVASIHQLGDLHATWQAVRQVSSRTQTLQVEHAVNDWPGTTHWSDPTTTTARVVLAAAAGAVGVCDGASVYAMDGRHLSEIAAAAGFVAEHEKLLMSGQPVVYDTNQDGLIDTVVVRAMSSVLTITANATSHPQTVHPRVGQSGDVPAEVTLPPGGWQTWRDDNAPIVPGRERQG